ncbi:DUF433 domain-containing protein [Sorangium sp. So ce327]|jgi:hypothetical protein
MNRDELLARISIDPNACFGRTCIRGHRIWVSLDLDFSNAVRFPEAWGIPAVCRVRQLPTGPRR